MTPPRTRRNSRFLLVATLALAATAGLSAAQLEPGYPIPMTLHSKKSTVTNDGFGRQVSAAGDVDADGRRDFIVGAPQLSSPSGNGRAVVFSGADGAVLHEFWGVDSGAHFGRDVSAAGDLDHDGHDDVLVAGEHALPAGGGTVTARVFSGATGAILFEAHADPAVGFVATALAWSRDIDGDAAPDFVVGCALADGAGLDSGQVRVYSGLTGQLLYNFDGSKPGERFGQSVATADVDADGHADIVVGAPLATVAGDADGGCVRIFSGLDGSLLLTLDSSVGGLPVDSSFTGYDVAAMGDIDHDGLADVAAIVDYGGCYPHVCVFSGLDGSILLSVDQGSCYHWAESIANVGDVNGDGTNDLLVGRDNILSGEMPRQARLYSGADGELLQTVLGSFISTSTPYSGGSFRSVAGPGDIDNDGAPDLLVGPPVRVFSGATSHWSAIGESTPAPGFTSFGLIHLEPYATLVPGSPVQIALRFASPGQSAWLLLGADPAQTPYKSGMLHVVPHAVVGLVVGPEGETVLHGTWPAGVPSGFALRFQAVALNPAATQGVDLTYAVQIDVP